MNPLLDKLQPYPFERLRSLLAGINPPEKYRHISLGIGEPKHATPQFIKDALVAGLDGGLAYYPITAGEPHLRDSIRRWLMTRYELAVDTNTQILPMNGTQEALFAFAQTEHDPAANDYVVFANPCYQIYE